MGRGQVHKSTSPQTDGHRDSMTESAQWADSVKIVYAQPQTIGSKTNGVDW